MNTLSRTKTDGRFELTGPSGSLTYDPACVELSADGDLPLWVVASGHATDCDVSLNDWHDGGEGALWSTMEAIYRQGER